jgi:hypothetical protein
MKELATVSRAAPWLTTTCVATNVFTTCTRVASPTEPPASLSGPAMSTVPAITSVC